MIMIKGIDMKTLIKISSGLLLALTLGATTGCSGAKTATEADFGNSVRQMSQAQTLNPTTRSLPDPDPIDYGDGERLNNVMETYRQDVSKPETVKEDIVINLGN
jgi:hypothetical protein